MSKPWAVTYKAPWKGLNVQVPVNQLDPGYFPAINNFLLRNSEIRSRPDFDHLFAGPDSFPLLGMASFLSPNLQWHTVAVTTNGLYDLNRNNAAQQVLISQLSNAPSPWTLVGAISGFPVQPLSIQSYQGCLYYSNGPHLSAWDGSRTFAQGGQIKDAAFSGTVNPPTGTQSVYGGYFIGELDTHLIIASVIETSNAGSGTAVLFPQRVRWSNSGFTPGGTGATFGSNLGTAGATFDPTVNTNAGFNDMTDTPDIITGFMALGRVGYVFRQNGITELSPTGNGIAPFDFNHLWASQKGIGHVYPFTIAQYGSLGVFISQEQIYQVGVNSFVEIGDGARDAIMADLAAASATPVAGIMPVFAFGYVYLAYQLFIPQGTNTVVYVYGFEEKNWSKWTVSNVGMMATPNMCWT